MKRSQLSKIAYLGSVIHELRTTELGFWIYEGTILKIAKIYDKPI